MQGDKNVPKVVLNFLSVIVFGLLSGSAFCQTGEEGADKVLEQLEQQIMSDEADGLSHFKSPNGPFGLQDETAPINNGVAKTKSSNAEAAQDFSQIHKQIKDLERDIDTLSSDVQQYKQAAVVASKDNSYVYLEANIMDADKNNLKSIRVKVDGFTVYQVRDTAGLWTPKSAIPLYSGPLSAGTHRIEISANIGEIQKPGLPVNGPSFKSVEKTFEIQVPLGSTNRKYQIAIAPAADAGAAPNVTLKDSL
jgi:hypothetical protein